jgi:hypothetical protein
VAEVKIALIPPTSLLHYGLLTGTQLALPHLMDVDNRYYKWYAERVKSGNHVILDNGAAEHVTITPKKLQSLAQALDLAEVVAPDVMGDADATVKSTIGFLQGLAEASAYRQKHMYRKNLTAWWAGRKVGVVAQGASEDDALRCVSLLLGSQDARNWVDVVYIPRLLIGKTKNLDVRISLAHKIQSMLDWSESTHHVQIHCLGMDAGHPEEVRDLAVEAPFVRSLDTSLPFNWAHAGAEVDNSSGASHGRPEGYFDLGMGDFDIELLTHNVNKVLEWAGGDATEAPAR